MLHGNIVVVNYFTLLALYKFGEPGKTGRPGRQNATGQKAGYLVVGVLAALVLGEVTNAFQLREFVQQLLLDPFFQRDINH
jgi:hypothetical protein